jgi:hypothetical protein
MEPRTEAQIRESTRRIRAERQRMDHYLSMAVEASADAVVREAMGIVGGKS